MQGQIKYSPVFKQLVTQKEREHSYNAVQNLSVIRGIKMLGPSNAGSEMREDKFKLKIVLK